MLQMNTNKLNSLVQYLFFLFTFTLFPYSALAQGMMAGDSCPMCGLMGGAGLFLAFVLAIVVSGFLILAIALVIQKFRHSPR